MILDNNLVDSLKKELSNRVKKNAIIASSIANIDKPGYKAKRINFERHLNDVEGVINMKVANSKHFTVKNHTNGYVIVENPNNGRADGNNFSIEKEMRELTINNIRYNIAVQFLAKELAHLRNVVVFEGNGK